jgi:sugar/nucleoside kinase (ribokinase family)
MDATATFTLSAWLGQDSPIKYAGEEVTTATVAARLGGATQVRYFTASGVEVPGEAVAALGLGR